jgi:hypothetical protein
MKRLVVTGTAVISLVVGGVALSPVADAARSSAPASDAASGVNYQPPPIVWGTCSGAMLQSFGAQCGFLTVPLDYRHPSGTKIMLHLAHIRLISLACQSSGRA